jgi:hypothetical protein
MVDKEESRVDARSLKVGRERGEEHQKSNYKRREVAGGRYSTSDNTPLSNDRYPTSIMVKEEEKSE